MTDSNREIRDELLRQSAAHVHRQQFVGSHEQDRADAITWLARYKGTMTQFKVWDSINGEQEEASVIEAFNGEEAAVLFAEDDCDGRTDGLYQQAHPIFVLAPGARSPLTYEVQVEYSPSYRAALKG